MQYQLQQQAANTWALTPPHAHVGTYGHRLEVHMISIKYPFSCDPAVCAMTMNECCHVDVFRLGLTTPLDTSPFKEKPNL